jgi:hypothetical protein
MNNQRQRRLQQQRRQEEQQQIDNNLANILENVVHINPLDYQQFQLFNNMLAERDCVIILGRIFLVLIFLTIFWNFRLLEYFF